jgi:TPR repeat protein
MAASYYERAAAAGSLSGIVNAAVMAESGSGRGQDFGLAVQWYRAAAGRGVKSAEVRLALLMWRGKGFPAADPAGALAILRRLADPPENVKEAQYYLGVMYDQGAAGVPRDAARAMQYLRQAHNQGVPGATCDIAAIHLEGRDGVPQDVNLGMAMLGQAAGQGDSVAHYNLGLIHQEGKYGRPLDPDAARREFEIAAEGGAVPALVKFGSILWREAQPQKATPAGQQKLMQAARYFRTAAVGADGHPQAQNNYGKMLMLGEGVPRDCVEARKWLFLAAKHGAVPMALVNIAEIVMEGLDGKPRNPDAAIRLLQQAKAQGCAEAERRLAQLGL